MGQNNSTVALNVRQLTKRFGAHTALDAVSLQVTAGTIHALLGENGAGKSTLMHIVSGLFKPNAGGIELFGKAVAFHSPLDAVQAGIGMVHQHFLLVDALTVAENVALGKRSSRLGLQLDRFEAARTVLRIGSETGLELDPEKRVSDLPVGLRQRVEIVKALARGANLLLLDEPTAVLAPPEIEKLFATLRRLRDAGRTIVLITHKLDEVFALASECSVLRKGKLVHCGPLAGLSSSSLAEKMVGRSIETAAATIENDISKNIILKVSGIAHKSTHGSGLQPTDFEVHAGELVGVAGVEGNGQDELAGLLSGLLTPDDSATCSLQFMGQEIVQWPIRRRAAAGMAVIPSDRQREGLILEMSLAENLFLREVLSDGQKSQTALSSGPWLSIGNWPRIAREWLSRFDVQPPEPQLPAGALSGGNQQKVVLARELHRQPQFILACNPTRGLDIGAAAKVYNWLLKARASGTGILLISSDLDEVLRLADRVAVLYRGCWRELGLCGVSKTSVGLAMAGLSEEPAEATS